MRMGLREANQQFAKAIRAVKAGEEVVLTERGKPVAVITPWRRRGSREAAIRALRSAGLIRAVPKPGPLPRVRRVRIKGGSISRTIEAMRDER